MNYSKINVNLIIISNYEIIKIQYLILVIYFFLIRRTTLFEELTATNTNLLPACFVMKLKTRMPICEGLINQMKEITDIEVSKIEGPLPILSLIKREIHKKFIECEEDSSIVV